MEDCLQVYLDEELFPAYAWVFPGPDGCANVGCGISLQQLTSSAASRRLRLAMRRFMNKVLTADQALPSTLFPPNLQGFPLRSDFPRIPLYQQGAMVVGEAAGLVDPITGEGIYTAMRSGWLAARVAGYALESGDFSVEPLKVYSEIVREWYGDDYQSAQNIMSWLAQPGIERSLIHQAKENQQVRQGLEKAFLEKRLAEGLATLQAAVTLPG
jgi:digeranylgeranylglycerophospholipid reductase